MKMTFFNIIGIALACSFTPKPAYAASGEPDFKVAVIGEVSRWSTIQASHRDWIEFSYYRNYALMIERSPAGMPIPVELYLKSVKDLGIAMADIALKVKDSRRCEETLSGSNGNARTDFSKVLIHVIPEGSTIPGFPELNLTNYFGYTFPGGPGPQRVVFMTPAWGKMPEKKAQSLVLAHEIGHWFGNAAAAMHSADRFGPDVIINGITYAGSYTSNFNDPDRYKNQLIYNSAIAKACGY